MYILSAVLEAGGVGCAAWEIREESERGQSYLERARTVISSSTGAAAVGSAALLARSYFPTQPSRPTDDEMRDALSKLKADVTADTERQLLEAAEAAGVGQPRTVGWVGVVLLAFGIGVGCYANLLG